MDLSFSEFSAQRKIYLDGNIPSQLRDPLCSGGDSTAMEREDLHEFS
jgi:hypothetical protein